MTHVEILLLIIAVVLLTYFGELRKINSRLKERFPTDAEANFAWALKDPQGHWEAHKDDQ